MEAGAYDQSWGALLLFLANVAAILLTGVVVMALFRVHQRSLATSARKLNRRRAIEFVPILVVIIAIPLGAATVSLTRETIRDEQIADVADRWADEVDWLIVNVGRVEGTINIVATGPLPLPGGADLRAARDAAGLTSADVTLRLIPESRVELAGS